MTKKSIEQIIEEIAVGCHQLDLKMLAFDKKFFWFIILLFFLLLLVGIIKNEFLIIICNLPIMIVLAITIYKGNNQIKKRIDKYERELTVVRKFAEDSFAAGHIYKKQYDILLKLPYCSHVELIALDDMRLLMLFNARINKTGTKLTGLKWREFNKLLEAA